MTMWESALPFSFNKGIIYHQGWTTYLEQHILVAEPTSGSDLEGECIVLPCLLYQCLLPWPSLGCMCYSRVLKGSKCVALQVCPSLILSLSNHWQTEPQAGILSWALWMLAGFINAFCGSKMVNTLVAASHPTAWKKKKRNSTSSCVLPMHSMLCG